MASRPSPGWIRQTSVQKTTVEVLFGRPKLLTELSTVFNRSTTICNCCPCCCLWRMIPQLDPAIGAKVVRLPGVSVMVTDRCAGCGTCAGGVCFVDAIRLVEGRAAIGDACQGCGRCVEVCPSEAIELTMHGGAYQSEAVAGNCYRSV